MLFACLLTGVAVANAQPAMLSGRVLSSEKEIIDFATVYLKGTNQGGITNAEGIYHLKARAGRYTLVVSAVGYKTVEMVKRSAFNAVAVDTKELQNTTKNLSEALAKAPGMKLRESGGVGSDMQVMMDGFSGKHVKVFIDGIPQEGTGSSFGLNNIPVGFAERIEVYKGVVPVGFGTDAIGGVINIVTNKQRRRWFDLEERLHLRDKCLSELLGQRLLRGCPRAELRDG